MLAHTGQYMGGIIWFTLWQGRSLELTVQNARWVPNLAWICSEQKTICTLLAFLCPQYTNTCKFRLHLCILKHIQLQHHLSNTLNYIHHFLVTKAIISKVAWNGACLGKVNKVLRFKISWKFAIQQLEYNDMSAH